MLSKTKLIKKTNTVSSYLTGFICRKPIISLSRMHDCFLLVLAFVDFCSTLAHIYLYFVPGPKWRPLWRVRVMVRAAGPKRAGQNAFTTSGVQTSHLTSGKSLSTSWTRLFICTFSEQTRLCDHAGFGMWTQAGCLRNDSGFMGSYNVGK